MKKIIVVSLTTIAFAGCLPQQTEQVDLPIETPQQEEQIEKIGLTNQEVQTTAKYLDYSAENLAASSGKTLIFFHASWCPSCKELNKEINEKLSELPSNLTILKADYDTEKELKKKYNIVTQHTLVEIDQNGNELQKWVGGDFAQIQKSLTK
ncbi:hypothetical protein COU74_00885 [Candidatus Peregrinibacteria bacterium CG10_big_fil_rev_8_21_14_0_10_36_19]|nr:MAG: hypothetical protein COU74_00885 [Candidatus Peregrinibacteria bacterium CG10_big_fil_rev_8_21_14_0_10_36_19]